MEIELLLPIKNIDSLNEYVLAQRHFIERISFAIGTYQIFSLTNEVIDINRRKIISRTSRLSKIFKGSVTKPFVFVFCKN